MKGGSRTAKVLTAGFIILAAFTVTLLLITDSKIPSNTARLLSPEETRAIVSENSPLTDYVYLSPNATFPRENDIEKITVHHMGEELTLEELGEAFSRRSRSASSNYAIDSDGRVALYVEEKNAPWTSSNSENDSRAVTIEVSNNETGGDWRVSDEAFLKLAELCADICERNGIEELVYTGSADGSLTTHDMFDPRTECPGPYLKSRMGELADAVNDILKNQ